MRSLPQREFAQRREVRFGEEIFERLMRFFRRIDDAALQAVQQRARRDIHHHHFIGFLHHPVGHGLAHADAGDVPDLIVEALDVLDVDAGEDIDARIENLLNVLPALGAFGAGHVGVGELVDRPPPSDAVRLRPRCPCLRTWSRDAA